MPRTSLRLWSLRPEPLPQRARRGPYWIERSSWNRMHSAGCRAAGSRHVIFVSKRKRVGAVGKSCAADEDDALYRHSSAAVDAVAVGGGAAHVERDGRGGTRRGGGAVDGIDAHRQ